MKRSQLFLVLMLGVIKIVSAQTQRSFYEDYDTEYKTSPRLQAPVELKGPSQVVPGPSEEESTESIESQSKEIDASSEEKTKESQSNEIVSSKEDKTAESEDSLVSDEEDDEGHKATFKFLPSRPIKQAQPVRIDANEDYQEDDNNDSPKVVPKSIPRRQTMKVPIPIIQASDDNEAAKVIVKPTILTLSLPIKKARKLFTHVNEDDEEDKVDPKRNDEKYDDEENESTYDEKAGVLSQKSNPNQRIESKPLHSRVANKSQKSEIEDE